MITSLCFVQLLYPFLQLVVEHKISGVPNVHTDGTKPS